MISKLSTTFEKYKVKSKSTALIVHALLITMFYSVCKVLNRLDDGSFFYFVLNQEIANSGKVCCKIIGLNLSSRFDSNSFRLEVGPLLYFHH